MHSAPESERPRVLGWRILSALVACTTGLAGYTCAHAAEDPWPFHGRTATRLGNTMTIGPKTPTLDWSIWVPDLDNSGDVNNSSAVMDSQGRLFIGRIYGIAAVDTLTRTNMWSILDQIGVYTPAVMAGRVVWGTPGTTKSIYCARASDGEILWSLPVVNGCGSSPVISPDGTVYVNDRAAILYALRLSDGEPIWTNVLRYETYCQPTLDWPNVVTSGEAFSAIAGVEPLEGGLLWEFGMQRQPDGFNPIDGDNLFIGNYDRNIYCLDKMTGEEKWRFTLNGVSSGATAIGHDGTVYTCSNGGFARLYALDPDDGHEIWHVEFRDLFTSASVFDPPIVDGDGTIYVPANTCCPSRGRIVAVSPEGEVLWIAEMPDTCASSPMLAPDGTLYVVCSDQYLYAFRDPISLSLTGVCPGALTVSVQHATANQDVALIYARNTGGAVIPSGNPCAGLALGLNNTAALVATKRADSTGAVKFQSPNTAPRACGLYVQALDLTWCKVSNVVQIP